jgi:two-component system sensor histidine kinase TtrS
VKSTSCFKILHAGLIASFLCAVSVQAGEIIPIRIGYFSGVELNFESSTLQPLLAQLNDLPEKNVPSDKKDSPRYQYSLSVISPVDVIEEIKKGHLNFIVAPSNYYLEIADQIGATHLATRKNLRSSNPSRSIGSVFIVRSDREDLRELKDLRNQRAAASLPNSLGGWLAAMGELDRNGLDTDNFFSHVSFTQFQVPDIINQVLSGATDVGVLSTCVLEDAISEGLLAPEDIKVINSQHDYAATGTSSDILKCERSTKDLYPDWVIVALPGTDEEIVRKVTATLLTMPDFSNYRWSIECDYFSVRQLLQKLKTGPYQYLKDYSVKGLYHRYSAEILFILALLAFLILNEIRLHFLVNKRTRELSDAIKQRDKADEIATQERKKISLIERNGVISQMSSIIAHEANQPLATITNYVEVLRLGLKERLPNDKFVESVMNNLNTEIYRLSSLIDTVRSYAKKQKKSLRAEDLIVIVKKALRNFEINEPGTKNFKVELKSDFTQAIVLADRLSLELLILNLIRNGYQAAVSDPNKSLLNKPKVGINIRAAEENRVALEIWNSGEILSDEQFEKLHRVGDSLKEDGLGLGLSIVREITENHGAGLNFERRKGGGLVATLTLDLLVKEA